MIPWKTEYCRKNSRIGIGFVHGFGLKNGAIASTVAHDSHNICVIGTSENDMTAAVNALIEQQGGLVTIQNGEITAMVPLPGAGLISPEPAVVLNGQLRSVLTAAKKMGLPCKIHFSSFLLSHFR